MFERLVSKTDRFCAYFCSMFRVLCFLVPGHGPGPNCVWQPWPFSGPSPEFVFTDIQSSICMYWAWLIRTGNNKSQRLHIMLLFLFLITVIVYRYETSKEQIKKKLTTISQVKQKKKQSEIN